MREVERQSLQPCPQTPAPKLMDRALCLCSDFNVIGASLLVEPAAGGAANVGVNGTTGIIGLNRIDGRFDAHMGVSGLGQLEIRDTLSTTANVGALGRLSCGGDLNVGGNLASIGLLSVGGTLRVAGRDGTLGLRGANAKGPYQPPAGPPCGCDNPFDVAAVVTAASTTNDNASIGLSTDAAKVIGLHQITLKTGRYYLKGVKTLGAVRLKIEGIVALFIDGNIDTIGAEQIALGPNATLDLYVAGSLRTIGLASLGAQKNPSAFRLYVGGADPVIVSVGAQAFFGSIYAPRAKVGFIGGTFIEGSLFADRLDGIGILKIRYHAPQPPPPSDCPPPGTPPGTPPPSGDDGGIGITGGSDAGDTTNPPIP